MNKKIPLFSVVILLVLAVVVTFNVTYLTINEKHNKAINDVLSGYSFFDKLLDLHDFACENYVGEMKDEDVVDAMIKGYLEGLGDPYAQYLTAEEYAAFQNEQGGNAVGIGINVITDSEAKTIEIISVIPESPAEVAGLCGGDFIVAVDGTSVAEIGYYAAVNLIAGEKDTSVTLTVRRGEEELTVTCVRQEIKTQSVSYHVFADDHTVGVIRISEFNGTTPDQFKEAVETLKEQGCKKFVFDLRYNPGGELNSILSVLDYLLPEGPLAHIFYQSGSEKHYDSDASYLDAPMAVLINRQTASAAELFASSIRDYAKEGQCEAVLVGVKTYGKGVLQTYYRFKDGSAFKISVGRYDPPYGENYDGMGVLPDIEVELSEEASKINFNKLTDKNDNQLIAAIHALADQA
ncbi:MAG: S41 family peptidase [Ruminococcaceae bacterium]|nr:S41 family peptidase [Oscillospiraceae bacterium]